MTESGKHMHDVIDKPERPKIKCKEPDKVVHPRPKYVRWDEANLRKLFMLLDVGMHSQDAADIFGVSRRAVQAVYYRYWGTRESNKGAVWSYGGAAPVHPSPIDVHKHVKLTPVLVQQYDEIAKQYGVHRDVIIRKLLAVIAKDGLLNAILDE